MKNPESIILAQQTIGELVALDYRKAEIFKRHGIDFCCKGNITIEDVCKKKNVDPTELLSELQEIEQKHEQKGIDYNIWDLGELATHITKVHHQYVRQAIPIIDEFMQKVCKVHGDHNPELHVISKYFDAVAQELMCHMQKEEVILFPYIKELNQAFLSSTKIEQPAFGTIRNPIAMMEAEHVSAGSNMEQIEKLTCNYTPPAHACATYRVLFFKLQEFEKDLHHHIHLENNILFKKAIAQEEVVFS